MLITGGTFPSKDYSMFASDPGVSSTYLDPSKLEAHPTSIGQASRIHRFLSRENGEECPPDVIGRTGASWADRTRVIGKTPRRQQRPFAPTGASLAKPWFSAVTESSAMRKATCTLFVARGDEMIMTRGFRVSPTEVEAEAVGHPDIVDAVAFAVPNISIGRRCCLRLDDCSGSRLREQLLKQYLKPFAQPLVPAYLIHFESFPITGNARGWIASR